MAPREARGGVLPPAGFSAFRATFFRRGPAPPRASHAAKGRGGISSAALPCVFRGGSGVAGSPIGVAAHTAPARHRGASRYRRGIVPCGPLRVLGHCPAGRFDRRRALGRRFFIFMRPRRGSRARAECPQGDRPLRVFLYSEAVRCRRVCARASCWTGPVHGMCRRNCVGSLRAF